MCQLSWNLVASSSWSPQDLSRPVMGLMYFYCKKILLQLNKYGGRASGYFLNLFKQIQWQRRSCVLRYAYAGEGHKLHSDRYVRSVIQFCMLINLLTPELNPSAQRCLTKFFTGVLFLEPCISLIYACKKQQMQQLSIQFINYVMVAPTCFGTHHVGKDNTPIHNILSTDPQLSISQKA
jgi:hypothetical protein